MIDIDKAPKAFKEAHQGSVVPVGARFAWTCSCGARGKGYGKTVPITTAGLRRHQQQALSSFTPGAAA